MKKFEIKRKQIEYLSKVLELVLFLIIERSLGLEGSGFFLVTLMIFTLLWTFFGEGLPDALGKIIRVRRSKGQFKSIRSIRIIAFFCQLVMGAIGSLLMLSVGTVLGEKVFLCPYASLLVWILSPLLFLRGLTFLFLGFCQGEGFELPAVVTCIARQIAVYCLGTVFGAMTGAYGEKVSLLLKQEHFTYMYTAAGWCAAYVVAELIMLAFVFISFLGKRRRKQEGEMEGMKASVTVSGYVSAIFRGMVFKVAVRFLELFPVAIGMMIFYHREGEKAPLSYGTYFVGYFAVCLMVYYLLCSISVPFWGKVYSFIRQDDKRLGRLTFHGGMHLLLILGLAFSVSIAMMPSQVGGLAGFTSPNLVKVVVPGSFWILFMSLAFYFSRMLMRLKKDVLCIGLAALCDILHLMVFLVFWKDEKMGILALMYAGLIATAVYASLLGAICIQMIGGRVNWLQVFWLPIIGAAVMGGVQYVCGKLFGMFLKDLYMVVGVGIVTILIYLSGLLMIRDFGEEELSVIPFGKFFLSFGKMLGTY